MKKYILILFLFFAGMHISYGQARDFSKQNTKGNSKLIFDKTEPGRFISVTKTGDGMHLIFSGDSTTRAGLAKITLIVVDSEIKDRDAFIDPGKIETAKILTAQEATALYGARGADGALIIYTNGYKAPGPVGDGK